MKKFLPINLIVLLLWNFVFLRNSQSFDETKSANFSISINNDANDRSIIGTINLNFENNQNIDDIANSINTENPQIKIWYNGMDGLLKKKSWYKWKVLCKR